MMHEHTENWKIEFWGWKSERKDRQRTMGEGNFFFAVDVNDEIAATNVLVYIHTCVQLLSLLISTRKIENVMQNIRAVANHYVRFCF